jgi:hypothetical protein
MSFEDVSAQREELGVQLRMKGHAIAVVKAKNEDMEAEIQKRDARIQEMRMKERQFEEMEGKMRKREEMLRSKIAECDRLRGLLDKKDVKIGEMRRDIKIMSDSSSTPNSHVLKVRQAGAKRQQNPNMLPTHITDSLLLIASLVAAEVR